MKSQVAYDLDHPCTKSQAPACESISLEVVQDSGSSTLFGDRTFAEVVRGERGFVAFLLVSFLLVSVTYDVPSVARWVGFAFAAYAVVANDSIQTIGTFLSSNRDRSWWALWLFLGGVFLTTVTYSFFAYGGDVSFGRLSSKGFSESPQTFSFLQVASPLFLLMLTRMKMPVSTTFLILSSFATTGGSVLSVLTKSLSGYVIAFLFAIVLWRTVLSYTNTHSRKKPHPGWTIAQWGTTGLLWSVWLMQDAANVAVYLPRQLSSGEFVAFASIITLGLGLLTFQRGDRIQKIVERKTDIVDVRPATFIDLIYAGILYLFKIQSQVPMSTTWVFLGLLAGREYGLRLAGHPETASLRNTTRAALGDLLKAGCGLAVSLIIAMTVNEDLRSSLANLFG